MLVIQLLQDSSSILKDILIPLVSIIVAIGVPVWYTNRQIKMQKKVALFEERIKFKDKILGKIDEIYQIFQRFAAGYIDDKLHIQHHIIYNTLQNNHFDLYNLISSFENVTWKIQNYLYYINNQIEYETYSLAEVLNKYETEFENLKILKDDALEYTNNILKLKNYEDKIFKKIFNTLPNIQQYHLRKAKSNDDTYIEYLKSRARLINNHLSKESVPEDIKKAKDFVMKYYEENLKNEHFYSEPNIIKKIKEIRQKIENNFVKEIKLEI